MSEPTKTCSRCGETKPLDAFHSAGSHHSSPDGRRGDCKDCRSYSKKKGSGVGRKMDGVVERARTNPILFQREDWQEQGACRGQHPNLFFGASTEIARTICRTCPVQTDCLEYALRIPIRDGMWGGMDENERRKLRNRRPISGAA